MKYNNIIPVESVSIPYNYITQTLKRLECIENLLKRREIIYDVVCQLYGEDINSKTETRVICNTNKKLQILIFKYNGCAYYWWDLLSSNGLLEASGLEFYPFFDVSISFLLFATRTGQSPLIWREHIRV